MISKNEAKYIQSLHEKKKRGEEGVFIAEGNKAVLEFLNEKFNNANKKQMENQKKNMIVGISTGVLIVLSIIINLFF